MNIVTEIKTLRVRLEQVDCKLEQVGKRLEKVVNSLDAVSEVLGLLYEEKYGHSPNWNPRLLDIDQGES